MSQYAHPEVLVDTQWLFDHLNDPNIRIIEMDINPEQYKQGHIPGTVFWNAIETSLANFRINFDRAFWSDILSSSGINKDTTVITINGNFPAVGAFIFWLLKVFGHNDVRVLDGGRHKWIAEGRPLSQEEPTITPSNYNIESLDNSLRVFAEEVYDSINKKDRAIVDVRTPQEYCGDIFMMKPPQGTERGGHIPSAIHLYYELALNEDKTFKSFKELEKIYSEKGITPDKFIIPYCAVGARSGHTWFVLKYLLGYPNVRNYDGSWNEWSRLSEMPILQGSGAASAKSKTASNSIDSAR